MGRRQAWATARPAGAIASPLRPQTARRRGRVGATLAVAHLESSTASFPSYEVASHALAASRADPNEATGNRHGRRQAWATARPAGAIASPLRPQTARRRGRVGATLAVAHLESSTASFPSYEVASHAIAASRADPNEATGNRHGRRQAWATARPAGAIASRLRIGGPAPRCSEYEPFKSAAHRCSYGQPTKRPGCLRRDRRGVVVRPIFGVHGAVDAEFLKVHAVAVERAILTAVASRLAPGKYAQAAGAMSADDFEPLQLGSAGHQAGELGARGSEVVAGAVGGEGCVVVV